MNKAMWNLCICFIAQISCILCSEYSLKIVPPDLDNAGKHAHFKSKDIEYRQSPRTSYGRVNDKNFLSEIHKGKVVENSRRHTIHPFYDPFIRYRSSYIRENLSNAGSKSHSKDRTSKQSHKHVTYPRKVVRKVASNNDFNKGFTKDGRTIGRGDYKEYINSDTSVKSNYRGTPTTQTLSLGNNFKRMEDQKDGKVHKTNSFGKNQAIKKTRKYRDACKFMEKMNLRHYIGKYGFDMMCSMYKQWGESMTSTSEKTPTQKQREWFDSLGSRALAKRRPSHRSKRQAPVRKALRQEYRVLTEEQRFRLHRAINILKRTFLDRMSLYDVIVQNHAAYLAPAAHFGPAFLGYHRELLLRFEKALQEVDPSVSVPYWDSNLDHVLGDELATGSILWSPSFLGNGVGDVTEGPFAYWRLEFPSRTSDSGFLHRNLTTAPGFARTMPALMSDQAILDFLKAENLRNTSWFVNPVYESHHGAVHNWVGGVMADIPISPSDPVFFMHHAFLDCLWEQMRYEQRKRDSTFDPQYDYPNDSVALGVGMEQPDGSVLEEAEESYHHAVKPMHPFDSLRNIDGLSNIYTDEFYSCQPSPHCTPSKVTCGSPYLFCDLSSYRCAPKLQLDSPCAQFAESKPCLDAQCCEGICKISCSDTNRYFGEAAERSSSAVERNQHSGAHFNELEFRRPQ